MSRIGKLPIAIPSGVTIDVSDDNIVTVKGPKGDLSQKVDARISLKQEEGTLVFERSNEQKQSKAMHGLYRALVQNMVVGVTEGYKKQLELVGVGFKADVKGQVLEMNLGYSHNIYLQVPAEVKVTAETAKGKSPVVTLESTDKELIGHVAAKIKSLRKVEPYKGKGVRFLGEQIRRKVGKAAAK